MNRGLRLVPGSPPAPDPADDVALVAALRARAPWAAATLVDRYREVVRRVLIRLLGRDDAEQADLVQEVFTHAWQRIGQLNDGRALRAWLTQMAVFAARGAIRRRGRRRWLAFFETVPEPDPTASWAGPELEEAARCVYRILDRLPADERIPFALRTMGGLNHEETADACGMSVATVRRRLARAERRFFKMARQCEALVPWLEDGA